MRRLVIGFSFILVLAWRSEALACGSVDVCADVSSSFWGDLGSQLVRVGWDTDEENSEVTEYKLYRYDCGTPSTCLVWVATINPRGNCTQTEYYTYDDDPPNPDDSWTYRLQVIKTGAVQACEYDVDPE